MRGNSLSVDANEGKGSYKVQTKSKKGYLQKVYHISHEKISRKK